MWSILFPVTHNYVDEQLCTCAIVALACYNISFVQLYIIMLHVHNLESSIFWCESARSQLFPECLLLINLLKNLYTCSIIMYEYTYMSIYTYTHTFNEGIIMLNWASQSFTHAYICALVLNSCWLYYKHYFLAILADIIIHWLGIIGLSQGTPNL